MLQPQRALPLLCLIAALFLFHASRCRADSWDDEEKPKRFAAELGIDVATGKYGNPTSTTTVMVPLSLLYFATPRLDFGIVVPYLWQSNDLVVGGRPVRRTLAQPMPKPKPAATRQNGSVSGVGDLLFSGGYVLHEETEATPQVRGVITIKAPTADQTLGTGVPDETAELQCTKSLADWYLFLDGAYTRQGKTSLFQARNFAEVDGGVGYEVLPGLRPSIGVKGATAAEKNTGGTLQVEGKVVYAATRAVDFKLYLDRGFTTTSPDWQGGCSVGYNF